MGSPAGPLQLILSDQTNITDCASTYSFFSLNVARLLKTGFILLQAYKKLSLFMTILAKKIMTFL